MCAVALPPTPSEPMSQACDASLSRAARTRPGLRSRSLSPRAGRVRWRRPRLRRAATRRECAPRRGPRFLALRRPGARPPRRGFRGAVRVIEALAAQLHGTDSYESVHGRAPADLGVVCAAVIGDDQGSGRAWVTWAALPPVPGKYRRRVISQPHSRHLHAPSARRNSGTAS
jgi:hypothetical protein